MRTVCPSCDPYKPGDHEYVQYRVCPKHQRLLERPVRMLPVFVDAEQARCPECGAPPEESCFDRETGESVDSHQEREKAARAVRARLVRPW